MKKKLLIGLSLLVAVAVFGQAIVATTIRGNSATVNNLNVSQGGPVKIYTVLGQNLTNTTIYVQIFGSNSPTAGAIPLVSVPVATQNFYSIDFGYYGLNLDGCQVVFSTNPTNFAVATQCGTIQAVIKNQ